MARMLCSITRLTMSLVSFKRNKTYCASYECAFSTKITSSLTKQIMKSPKKDVGSHILWMGLFPWMKVCFLVSLLSLVIA